MLPKKHILFESPYKGLFLLLLSFVLTLAFLTPRISRNSRFDTEFSFYAPDVFEEHHSGSFTGRTVRDLPGFSKMAREHIQQHPFRSVNTVLLLFPERSKDFKDLPHLPTPGYYAFLFRYTLF